MLEKNEKEFEVLKIEKVDGDIYMIDVKGIDENGNDAIVRAKTKLSVDLDDYIKGVSDIGVEYKVIGTLVETL